MVQKNAKGYKIVKRGDGRYSVKKRGGGLISGAEKAKILVAEKLVQTPKVKTAKPAEETAT